MKKIYSLIVLTVFLCCGTTVWGAQTLPYSYGFEDYELSTDGWTKYFGTSLSSNNNECTIVGTTSGAVRTGTYGFRFSSYQTSGANEQYLISPELDAAAGLDLTFWYKASKAAGTEKFKVGYSTTDTDVANFTWGEENSTNSTSWLKFEGSFPAGTKYVAIYYYSNYQYYLHVDDFEFVAKASGPALQVLDGITKISSGYNYNFGLATAGTLKMFTMNNPGTEAASITVTHTGNFTVTPATTISIPAGEGSVLAIYMPETTGSDVITITSTAESIDDFVINVSGTIRDESKFSETLLGGSIPEDWSTSGGTWSWSTTNGASNSAWYESSNYRLITPQLTVAEGELFSVEVQGTYSGYQGLKFEYSADGSTWTASATVPTITTDWQTLSFTDVPAGKYYIALHGWHVNVRNFYGGSIPSVPKNITLDSKTANSLTLSWTAAGSETAWKLQYSTDGENWSDEVAVATNPFELTGLNANTLYYVRVRADIASSEWSKTASFRTDCGAVDALPYAENFEGHDVDAAPLCWELLNAQSASTSTYPYIAVKAQSGYYKDAKALFIRSNANIGYAIFPEFSFSLAKAQIAFSHKEESATGTIVLGYLTNITDAETFVALYNCTSSSNWTDEEGISLASVPEDARLAFQHTGKSYYYDAAVDNITISLAPACAKPSGLTISEETAHTAKVAWTSEASEWDLEYKLSSAADWTAAASVTNPFTLTSLEANAAYDVRVRNNCGESQSDWIETSFNTPCETKTLPFSEDFATLPACWSASVQWSLYNYDPFAMRYTSSANGDLVLPSITLSDAAQLSFKHQSNYVSCTVILNDGEDHNLGEFAKTGDSYKTETIDLSAYTGKTVTITIRGNYYSGNRYLYIDDVAVNFKPVATPTNVVATPGNATATITWETEETGTWNLRYRPYNAEPEADWTNVANLEAKTYTIEGLTNGTEYEVQVQTIASANRQSEWTASATFTPAACASVETVTFGAKTYNSIVVNWTTTGAGTWDIRYKAAGDAEWTSAGTGLAEATKTLTSLTTGVAYTVEVKAACGDEESWVAGETFTLTYSAPATASVTDATDVAASASWGAVADADSYQYIVLASGEPNWESATAAAENSASLSGLNAGTAYTLYVRSVYSTGYSEAVSANFSTITIAPQNLEQVGDATTSSATFSWEANGAATQYQWSTDNTNWSAAQTALTATAEELTPGTSYTFYVRSYYSEIVQSAAISLSFQTLCAVKAMPFSENFNASTSLPACWVADEQWSVVANTGVGNTNALRLNSSDTADVQTPSIELTEDAILRFSHYSYYVSGAVYINSVDDEHKLIDLSTNSDFAQKTIDLAAYTGQTVTFIFRGNKYQSYRYLYIDNVEVIAKPCAAISSITATPASNKVVLAWESDADAFEYCVVASGEEAAGWQATVEKTATVTSLTPETAYTAYVRSVCSETKKGEASSANFTTECGAKAIPFEEDFSGDINCWTLENCHASTGLYNGAFRFYYNSNPPQYLISPEFVPSEKKVKVQFDYKAQSATYEETFKVGYSTTTKETSAFTWSAEVQCTATEYGEPYSETLPAGVRFVAIQYTSNNKYYLFIDNFSVVEDSETTAITNIDADTDVQKLIENNQLIIIRDGVRYNAQGQLIK